MAGWTGASKSILHRALPGVGMLRYVVAASSDRRKIGTRLATARCLPFARPSATMGPIPAGQEEATWPETKTGTNSSTLTMRHAEGRGNGRPR